MLYMLFFSLSVCMRGFQTVMSSLQTSSSSQTPASQLNTRPQDTAVYATVTNQQPDSNPRGTHSANQVTETDCDYYANMKSPQPTTDSRIELIYATVTHPQNIKTNDGQIYSVIKHK